MSYLIVAVVVALAILAVVYRAQIAKFLGVAQADVKTAETDVAAVDSTVKKDVAVAQADAAKVVAVAQADVKAVVSDADAVAKKL